MINLSRLDHAAIALAVYASQCGSPRPTQDSLPAGGQPLPCGTLTRRVRYRRFQVIATSSIPLLQASPGASPFLVHRNLNSTDQGGTSRNCRVCVLTATDVARTWFLERLGTSRNTLKLSKEREWHSRGHGFDPHQLHQLQQQLSGAGRAPSSCRVLFVSCFGAKAEGGSALALRTRWVRAERVRRRSAAVASSPSPSAKRLPMLCLEAVILSSAEVFAVDESWLSQQPARRRSQVAPPAPSQGEPHSERAIIEAALAASRGRVAGRSGAAARLGVPPSTRDHRIKALGIS
jgi:hypothetical protein